MTGHVKAVGLTKLNQVDVVLQRVQTTCCMKCQLEDNKMCSCFGLGVPNRSDGAARRAHQLQRFLSCDFGPNVCGVDGFSVM